MSRESKSSRWQRIHEESRLEFDEIQAASFDDRVMSLNDRLFNDSAGEQWAGLVEEDDTRPRLEFNKLANSIARLEGDFRNNRPSVSFAPSDGSPSDELADALARLYRADEHDSHMKQVDANASGDMFKGGMGAWRLRTVPADPTDPKNDEQRIRMEAIVDPESSVYFPLDCKEQNKSDAMKAWLLTTMTPKKYKALYGEDPSTWDDSIKTSRLGWAWYTPNTVQIAEYFVVDEEPEDFYVFKNVLGETFERPVEDFAPETDEDPEEGEGPEALRQLEILGNELVETKTRTRRRVKKYTMSGSRILKEETVCGRYIPIVVVYAERSFIDKKERWRGHVRKAKDAQRAFNALVSWLFEVCAAPPDRVPIFAPQQIKAHMESWTRYANGEKVPFLVADPLMNQDGTIASSPGPMGFIEPPPLPQALAAMLQFVGVDLKELLGSQEQGDKMISNISGKAVEMIQRHLDATTQIYLDNYAIGVQFSGCIWWHMAQEVYVEEGRKLKGIGSDGRTRSSITLGEPGVSENGTLMLDGVYDLSRGKYDVVVDVGPGSDTQKQAIARENTALLAVLPPEQADARNIITWNILKNAVGEGMGPTNDYAEMKLLEMGVGKPTPEQQAKMAQKAAATQGQPDAVATLQNAAAQKEAALAGKAQQDTALSAANTKKAEAETLKILGEARAAAQPQTPAGFPPRGMAG